MIVKMKQLRNNQVAIKSNISLDLRQTEEGFFYVFFLFWVINFLRSNIINYSLFSFK